MAAAQPCPDPYRDPAKLAAFGRDVTRRLNADPFVQHVDVANAQIYVVQDFLDPADCSLLIAMIDADHVPSALYRGTQIEGFRSSTSCNMDRWHPDVARIDQRIAAQLGIDHDYSETMQGQRYQVGQQFKAHHDFFHPDQDYWLEEGPLGGQRTWTAMIYLNEPAAGGATEFPHLGIAVTPRRGMLLIWNNMTLEGTPNSFTLHAGTPVLEGTKYIITKWFRQDAWQIINTPAG